MAFQLVYYSQQDPKWKQEILGFGDPGDTIGYVGCALTSVAMLLSGHGYAETPKTLNDKMKNVGGFVSAGIRWGSVSQIYPQVTVKSNISCANTNAPLDIIDASINAGQPVIVMVDSTPAAGLLTHWVLLYAREGNDYLMLDPWPYQTDVNKKTYLMPRYSQGNTLERAIMHVIVYQAFGSGGGIAIPSAPSTTTASTNASASSPMNGPLARIKADVSWGLNLRSSIDTSSASNIVAVLPAGTLLKLLEADGESKVGAVNQWARVRDAQGREGYAAAWYLEKVAGTVPAPVSGNNQPVVSEAKPVISTPATTNTPVPAPAHIPPSIPKTSQLVVMVKSRVGKYGANVHEKASASSKILANEKVNASLSVIEDAKKALPKIGVDGKWINVQTAAGVQGFIKSELVKLA